MSIAAVKSKVCATLAWRWKHVLRAASERKVLAGTLGWPAFLTIALAPICGRSSCGRLRRIRLRGFRHPLCYREGTSDADVIRQVFAHREYHCVASRPDVKYIIDCGANIGCTSYYLLSRYPEARSVVVEPDPGNMAMCRRNLAPFADRVVFVETGVWSHSCPLVVERGKYRDGEEWSFQVREAKPGEAQEGVATTVPELIRRSGFPRVDLLKMDIEAAEADVFRDGAGEWLPRIKTLVIELHGNDCERIVSSAVSPYMPQVRRSGELTVFDFN